jgi:uncharacterized protein (DUF58 family)
MIPTILNVPYLPGPVVIGLGGAATFDLVSPATAWLIMLAVLAVYSVLINLLMKPSPGIRTERTPRSPKRLVPRHA